MDSDVLGHGHHVKAVIPRLLHPAFGSHLRVGENRVRVQVALEREVAVKVGDINVVADLLHHPVAVHAVIGILGSGLGTRHGACKQREHNQEYILFHKHKYNNFRNFAL